MNVAPIYKKLGAAALLVVAFGFSQSATQDLVEERQGRQADTERQILDDWGRQTEVRGPFVRIPVVKTNLGQGWESSGAYYLGADDLQIETNIPTETRYRGIFRTTVYQADVVLTGNFSLHAARSILPPSKDPARPPMPEPSLGLEDVRFYVLLSDRSALMTPGTCEIGGESLVMEADAPDDPLNETNVSVKVPARLLAQDGTEKIPFKVTLKVKGSQGIRVTPTANRVTASFRSNWDSPNFVTGWLPSARQVKPGQGFEATYTGVGSRSLLATSSPSNSPIFWQKNAPGIAVDLSPPLNPYQPTMRAAKYGMLFIGMTFASLLLFEALGGLKLHVIHYLAVGSALALFFLLLLSLSERLTFEYAYVISASAVVLLIAGYASSVLQGWLRSGLISGGLSALYGYIYVLLQMEANALIFGSVGLFLLLAAFMYGTRRVDWHRVFERGTPTSNLV